VVTLRVFHGTFLCCDNFDCRRTRNGSNSRNPPITRSLLPLQFADESTLLRLCGFSAGYIELPPTAAGEVRQT
jgi:hypothetical protein